MMQSGQGPAWEVYDVQDTFGPTSLGGDNRVKRVLFHVAGGKDSYVDVPFTEFNVKRVAELIDAHVMDVMDVRALKGPVY